MHALIGLEFVAIWVIEIVAFVLRAPERHSHD